MSPSDVGIGIAGIVGVILAVAISVLLITHLLVPLFRGIAWVIARIFHFVIGMLADFVRMIGAFLAMILFAPLVLINILIGRWSASAHFASSVKGELAIAGACLYRICLGHPARLFGMNGLVEGIEQRFPQAVAQAPSADMPKGGKSASGRTGQFEGYKIVGSLPSGGSGSKLYIAEPDPIKRASLDRAGFKGVDQVVIKNFPVDDGSNLPNIVRESRALEAAKKLGLVLDHELSPSKFYYVMRYVPGQTLNVVIQQMHAQSDPSLQGLDDRHLRSTLGYVSDLVAMLDQYHQGGLWHKDVKPENIIVEQLHGTPRAHLVDFGLVTPLRSAMTLTTHGTEYFRDPELVRLALRGVKVHEVDGSKFDVYAAGAVLFAAMENSFPAHGVLSQVSRRCPEAVKWVIRRAMADYDKRYANASQMLNDLAAIQASSNPFAMKPIDLPSMRATPIEMPIAEAQAAYAGLPCSPASVGAAAYAGAIPPPLPNSAAPHAEAKRIRPDIRLLNWWTGEHVVVPEAPPLQPTPGNSPFGNWEQVAQNAGKKVEAAVDHAFAAAGFAGGNDARVRRAGVHLRSAREQVEAARARIQAKRENMKARRATWLGAKATGRYSNKPGAGSFVSSMIVIGGIFFVFLMVKGNGIRTSSTSVSRSTPTVATVPSATRDGAMETIRFASGTSADKPAVTKYAKKSRTPVRAEPLPVLENGAKALFVSDFPAPLSAEARARVEAVVDVLRKSGIEVTGDTLDANEGDKETVDRLAEARVAVSGVEIASSEFRDRLAELVNEKGLDLVVWLRPQLDTTGKPDVSKSPIAYVIASEHAEEVVRNTARDAISSALRSAK
ncbi:MAG: protein kinase domain-containing protein [Phycisphaerales bacterium]